MRFTTETQLHNHIQKEGVSGLYFLWGREDYLIRRWKDKLVAPFRQDGGFNYAQLEGQALDLYEVFDATQQLPLLAPQKCVLVEDVDIQLLVAAEMKKLEDVFSELPPETVLVMTVYNDGLNPRSARGKKVVELADKYGASVQLNPRDQAGLVRFAQSQARSHGCQLEAQPARELIRLCGGDMNRLTSELAKVCFYAGSGKITQKHLDAVVSPQTEERIFELGKAILAGNPQRVMEILTTLYDMQENPVGIVATLVMTYSDLYRARIARDKGLTLNQALDVFPYRGREFRLRNAYGTRISTDDVVRSLNLLYACDRDLKSTARDPEELLEQTVLAMTAVRGIA